MKRLALAFAAVVLIAATPQEVAPELEANSFYIEDGSNATEQVVSEAVFEGRADGGRLYIVVLAEEPPGGAPTFSDSVLDLLDGDGYVVTVAPDTVGFAGDGSFWSADEMNSAIDASLSGESDDAVVRQFISTLTGQPAGGGEPATDPDTGEPSGGGIPILWVLLVGGAVIAIWVFASRRNRENQLAERMEKVKSLANEKLDAVANDILEMEDEVTVSDNVEVKEHYRRASEMYSQAMEDSARSTTIKEMLDVSEELDLAIWELDCAEALLDGKPKPSKPQPPPSEPILAPGAIPGDGGSSPTPVPGTVDRFDRRPQRQSSGSNDMMTMLLTMMAIRGMRGRGGFGGPGGWGGGRWGGGGGRMGGGGGRMRGGGRRG